MKAWRITLWDYSEAVCYGPTRAKAVYALWLRSLSDSHTFAQVVKHMKARRAPELDKEAP